jgi:chromosome segregation ATPase
MAKVDTITMASSEYLKQASSMLRRAAEAVKQDVNDLERRIANIESEKGTQIHEYQRKEVMYQTAAVAADDSNQQQERAHAILEARRAQSNLERERNQIKADITQQIKNLQGVSQNLMQQASDVERLAGSV